MTSQRTLVLRKNRTYKIMKIKRSRKDNQYYARGIQKEAISFDAVDIWEEEKPFWKFWRRPRRMLLWVEGHKQAVRLKNDKEVDMGFLDLDVIMKAVKSMVVRAIAEVKSMTNTQFYVLALLGAVNIAVLIFALNRIGAI